MTDTRRTPPVGRVWPVTVRLRRCGRYECAGLLMPWQDIVREWDPECGGRLMHHSCHHSRTLEVFGHDDDEWTEWLSCEHRTIAV